MAKKTIFCGILIMMLVFGMLFVSCELSCACTVESTTTPGGQILTSGSVCTRDGCAARSAMVNNTWAVPCNC